MSLDVKQKVLIAIYTEYQKDTFDMADNIKSDILGLDKQVFQTSMLKLVNEGYIVGVNFLRTGQGNKIYATVLRDMMITREGIEYVETKLGIDKTLAGLEKAKYISKKLIEAGWDKGTDFAAKVVAELIKQS